MELLKKDPEKMTSAEKEIFLAGAIKSFIDSLDGPNDIHKQIVVECLIEFLYENKDAPLVEE